MFIYKEVAISTVYRKWVFIRELLIYDDGGGLQELKRAFN